MPSKRALERQLADLTPFQTPNLSLEQYTTPPSLAAHLIHRADLDGKLKDRTIIDLGTGTGMLAIAAATRKPTRVIGLDVDPAAIDIAHTNEQTLAPPVSIEWLIADATIPPLCTTATTVLMNPPFGAHQTHTHADRAFLETASHLAQTSYSIHNAGSAEFIRAFATDNNGTVTQAYAGTFDLPRQYAHHTKETARIEVELFRIDWTP